MAGDFKVLVFGTGDANHSKPLLDSLVSRGVIIDAEKVDVSGNKVKRYLPSSRQLLRISQKIEDSNPDIIVFDDERNRAAMSAILRANKFAAKPVIWFRGAVGGYNVLSPIDRYLLRHKDLARLVVRSYAMINVWTGSPAMRLLIPTSRIECCHHYIELKAADKKVIAAKRAEWDIAEGDIVIGSTANARPIKNIEFAVKATRHIRSDKRIRFLFIGGHDNAFRQRLEQIMPGAIVAPGTVADAGVFAGVFDIFVSPTRRPGEGFGLALAEAMACGVPVVASHAGGASDIVIHGETGYLLPDNEVSWAQSLQALVDAPELRRQMGQASKKRIAERFSVEAITSDFLRILKDVRAERLQM